MNILVPWYFKKLNFLITRRSFGWFLRNSEVEATSQAWSVDPTRRLYNITQYTAALKQSCNSPAVVKLCWRPWFGGPAPLCRHCGGWLCGSWLCGDGPTISALRWLAMRGMALWRWPCREGLVVNNRSSVLPFWSRSHLTSLISWPHKTPI